MKKEDEEQEEEEYEDEDEEEEVKVEEELEGQKSSHLPVPIFLFSFTLEFACKQARKRASKVTPTGESTIKKNSLCAFVLLCLSAPYYLTINGFLYTEIR